MATDETSIPQRSRRSLCSAALIATLAALSSVTWASATTVAGARIGRQVRSAAQAPAEAGAGVQAPTTAFGFRVGEERRYAIGPPDALAPGEDEQWRIRLVSVEGDAEAPRDASGAPGFRASFILEHEATRFVGDLLPWTDDVYQRFYGKLELVINRHGFPLRAEYRGELVTSEGGHYQEDSGLVFVEGTGLSYRRPARSSFLEAGPPYPTNDRVDLSVPRGVYVSPAESPALFTILLWGLDLEQLGKLEYVSVTPSGGGGLNWSPGLFHDTAGPAGLSPRTRAFPRIRLRRTRLQTIRFVERTTLETGGIERPAFRLREGGGEDLRPDVYVTAEGDVLQVDISTRRARTAWIRLLRPSEY